MRYELVSLVILLGVVSSSTQAQALNGPVLISDVRVFDGEHVLEHRSVLIENGRISRIGSAHLKDSRAQVVDGRGRTLLPGLIDAHVHVSSDTVGSLHQALALGVTTVLDMFTSLDTLKKLKQIEADDPSNVADVRTAGIGATAPGGHPSEMGGPPFPTISTAADAQAFVDQRIAEGSDFIKIIYDDLSLRQKVPMLDQSTLAALIRAAHRRHKLVVVHIGNENQARDVISAGADGLAHVFFGKTSSEDFGRFAAAHHVFVIPTLVTLYSACGIGDGKELLADPHLGPYVQMELAKMLAMTWPADASICRGSSEAVRQLINERVPILAGTDAPIPGTTFGASLHGELENYVKLGMTPLHALMSATSVPAHYFHLTDRGFIRTGQRADLLLVDGDPTRDILATRRIAVIFKKGVRVER